MFGSSARRLPRHAAPRWSYYPRHVKTRAIIGTGRDTAKAELRISPPYRYGGHPQRPPTHIAPVKGILIERMLYRPCRSVQLVQRPLLAGAHVDDLSRGPVDHFRSNGRCPHNPEALRPTGAQ